MLISHINIFVVTNGWIFIFRFTSFHFFSLKDTSSSFKLFRKPFLGEFRKKWRCYLFQVYWSSDAQIQRWNTFHSRKLNKNGAFWEQWYLSSWFLRSGWRHTLIEKYDFQKLHTFYNKMTVWKRRKMIFLWRLYFFDTFSFCSSSFSFDMQRLLRDIERKLP